MGNLLIIADDLTGATDSAAIFAESGYVSLVPLTLKNIPPADVLSIPINSRSASRIEAFQLVRQVLDHLICKDDLFRDAWIYKKLDSTLRGYPVEEFRLVIDRLGMNRALVALAFPEQGRKTVDGKHRIDSDADFPLPISSVDGHVNLVDLFSYGLGKRKVHWTPLTQIRDGVERLCENWKAAGPAVIIADSETNSDLNILAQAASKSDIRFLSGSAGFARQLCNVLPISASSPRVVPPSVPPGPVLVVAGTRNLRSESQIRVAMQQGIPLVRPNQDTIDLDYTSVNGILDKLSAHLESGQDAILSTLDLADSPLGSLQVTLRLGQIVKALVKVRLVGGLVLTGGETATAVCAMLDSQAILLQGEIQPGIPKGCLIGGEFPGMPIITKSGSFGTDSVLLEAIAAIKGGLRLQ